MYISLFILCLLLYLPLPALSDPLYILCGGTTTFSENSTYQANINLLFSSLAANSSSTGFADGTVGTVPNRVSGLVLCRGDVNNSSCSSCLSIAFQDALQLCPYDRAATVFYDNCLLRFSNEQFISSTDNSIQQILYSTANVTSDPTQFDQIVTDLITNASAWASYNSTRRFALAEATNFSQEYPVIYGLVQCTPDLTGSECQSCFQGLIDEMKYFEGRQGGRILGVRCNFRYEVYSFYSGKPMVKLDATTLALPPAPVLDPTKSTGKKTNTTIIAIGVAIPVVAVCLLVIALGFCFWKKKHSSRKVVVSYEFNSNGMEGADSLLLDLSTLRTVTMNFNESNKLGEGGFGSVYKGTLPNGQYIAVKRLSQSSAQGLGELKNELVLAAKLVHKNLVRIVGVCIEEQEKLLVYEFIPNGSLDKFLFTGPEKREELNWRARIRIINGLARGLQYLHEDSQIKIIHRDLKASNVLLDVDMTPKIADFGLARLFSVDQTTDVTKRVMGTLGYMAPEYAMHGLYSIKSDVFSFGILILEIITGKRNRALSDSDEAEDLLSSAWEHWTAGTVPRMIDATLRDCPTNEIVRYVHIALLCVQDDPTDRPKMSEVVIMLSSNTMSLHAPSRPPFCVTNTGSCQSCDMPSQVSRNKVSITELDAR